MTLRQAGRLDGRGVVLYLSAFERLLIRGGSNGARLLLAACAYLGNHQQGGRFSKAAGQERNISSDADRKASAEIDTVSPTEKP